MIRSLPQETVNEITRLDRQAEFTVCFPLIHYLDPNVPEVPVSTRDRMEINHIVSYP